MELEESLKALIIERLFLDMEPSAMENDVPLTEYGVDSFLLLELIVAIEEAYGVAFEQSDIKIDVLKTVSSIAALVRSKNPSL